MKVEYIGKRSEKWRWSMLRWYDCQVNIYINEEKEDRVFELIEWYLKVEGGWDIDRVNGGAIANMRLGRLDFDFFMKDWRNAKQFARDCGFKIR